jgi:hypothetical protein
MNMQRWNFFERAQGIENKVVYIENYMEESDLDSVNYTVQVNVEDADTETIDASFRIQSNRREDLEAEIEEIKKVFEGEEIIENW